MAKRHSSCATRLRPYSFFVVTYVHVITCVPGRVICNQPNTSFLILWLLEHHPQHSEPPASDFALPLVIGGRLTCVIPLLQVSHYGAEITREWIPVLRCDVLITSLCTGCTTLLSHENKIMIKYNVIQLYLVKYNVIQLPVYTSLH